jgi:hypothetical protein
MKRFLFSKNGAASLEIFFIAMSLIGGCVAYAHTKFVLKEDIIPRLDRIERKIDCYLGDKSACS